MTAPTTYSGLQKKKTPWGAIPLVLLTLVFAILATNAFAAPLTTQRVVDTQILQQEVCFDYDAVPRRSTLYPEPQNLGRQASYLVKLLDKFTVHITCKIAASPEQQVLGTHLVTMRLQAGNYWTKEYILSPKQTFTGEGNFIALELPVTIPFRDLLAFGETVSKEAEIGVGIYTLSINPVIRAQTQVGERLLQNEHTPSFQFQLTPTLLTPVGLPRDRFSDNSDPERDLIQTQSVSADITETVPGSFSLMGIDMPPQLAGTLSVLLSITALIWSSLLIRPWWQQRRPPSEKELIEKRYGSRLIKVNGDAPTHAGQKVMLTSFKALLTIADEREKSIFHTCIGKETTTDLYYLIDDGIAYCYSTPAGGEVGC